MRIYVAQHFRLFRRISNFRSWRDQCVMRDIANKIHGGDALFAGYLGMETRIETSGERGAKLTGIKHLRREYILIVDDVAYRPS